MHYSSCHKMLLVGGEGDFSFAACLAKAFGTASNMVASSLDSKESLAWKYTGATSNLKKLEDLDCKIVHGIDTNTMSQHLELYVRSFDRIGYNFPHAGFIFKENDIFQIERHRSLVSGFLTNARKLLRENGEIHVTHKTAYPYSRWEIEKLAEEVWLRKCRSTYGSILAMKIREDMGQDAMRVFVLVIAALSNLPSLDKHKVSSL